ncbi:unnamed protein product [[Candida] boidinii]|nr:unnamed protein product [[Candida] boidinii]
MNQERPIPPHQSLFSNNRSYNSLASLNNKSSTNLNNNFTNKARHKSNVSTSSRSSIAESNQDIYHGQDGQSINMPSNNDAGDMHNVNTVLNTMTIDTDLIDAIFGADNLYFSEENYY